MLRYIFLIASFCAFTSASATNSSPLPITLKNGWSFKQSNSEQFVSVKTGAHLSKQVPDKATCCSGEYRIELDISELKTLHNENHIGILFPPIGGLQSITINNQTTSFPKADYTSTGPILPISEAVIQEGKLKLTIQIDTLVNPFAGMWKNSPVIDVIPKLTIQRDETFIFQKTLPLFFAIIFFMFGATFTWIQYRSHIKSPMYQEYVYGFFSWSVFFLFLSGTVRSAFPVVGSKLHYSIRGIAGITTFRIISTYAKMNRNITNKITQLLLLIFISIAFASLFSISDEIQILAIFIINLFCIYPLYVLPKENREPADIVFFVVASISVTGNFIDAIHLYCNTVGLPFPILFLNRITTPPFLFLALIYLGNHLMKEITKSQKSKAYEEISAQVSHDIRSPLSALEVISGSLNELPQEKRVIIRNSINRIRDISNSLMTKKRDRIKDQISKIPSSELKGEESVVTLLSPLIDSIISEKRIQYRNLINIQIEFNQSAESYGLFANIDPNEFKRVLSNLIDNSVEAFKNNSGIVELILKTNPSNQIELLIKDNGKGIPENILPKLGTRGETHGKENGSGLGLFHAKETIESFNGHLKLESKLNTGTTVIITLPKVPEPSWFVSKLSLKMNQTVIVFDDDQSIHGLWDDKFEKINADKTLKIQHFNNPSDLKKFYRINFADIDEALFLMDYEINGTDETGLDVIETLGVQKQSILITSRYEEKHIRERCEKLGVKLIPKPMSGFVPIEIN